MLSVYSQKRAANAFSSQLCRLPAFIFAKRMAFYMANDGELDVSQTMAIAQTAGKQCYLPVLHPLKHNRLLFMQHRSADTLVNNRYAIPEPVLDCKRMAASWTLDVILLPLVGFDEQCNRIGMGGGFYDRTLAFKKHSLRKSPMLVGVAHDLQKVAKIPINSWDIPLDMVITEKQIYTAKKSESTK